MRFEDIRRQFKNEFVLIEVTKTDADNIEILEGNILIIQTLLVRPDQVVRRAIHVHIAHNSE